MAQVAVFKKSLFKNFSLKIANPSFWDKFRQLTTKTTKTSRL
jgi:hypothetical protein